MHFAIVLMMLGGGVTLLATGAAARRHAAVAGTGPVGSRAARRERRDPSARRAAARRRRQRDELIGQLRAQISAEQALCEHVAGELASLEAQLRARDVEFARLERQVDRLRGERWPARPRLVA